MAAVEERLELDIGPALASVGELETALSGVGESLSASFDAAVAGFQAELAAVTAAPVSVPIDGDITELEAGLAAVDDRQVTVAVDADTSEADAALDALADSAATTAVSIEGAGTASEGAGLGFDHLSGSATILATTMQGAARGGAGLGATLGALLGRVNPLVGGLAGIVGGTTALGVGAIDADTASRRLDSTFGDLAARINGLSIDGLGDDLSDLAIAAASDDDALRLVAAGVADLGAASGKTRSESAGLAEAILDMSLRLAILRPELGSAEQIADRLAPALTRGGRALTQFGLSAPSAQIEALAQQIAGAGNQVTQFDRILAGARIAARGLGTDADALARAAESPALAFRRLKTELDEALEAAGSEILPELTETVVALTPAVVALANAFGDIAVPAASFFSTVVRGARNIIETGIDLNNVAVSAGTAALDWSRGTDELSGALDDLSVYGGKAATTIGDVGGAAETTTGSTDALGRSVEDVARDTERMNTAFEAAERKFSGQIGAAVDRFKAFADVADAKADLAEAIAKEGRGSDEAREAAVRLAEAHVDLDTQTRILSGGTRTAASDQEILKRRFGEAADQINGPNRVAVQNLLTDLTRLKDPNALAPPLPVDVDTAPANLKLDRLERRLSPDALERQLRIDADISPALRKLDALDRRIGSADALDRRLSADRRAHGGSFHANQLLLVGEEGPELVRFGQGGTVINNTDSRRLAGDTTVNVYEVGGDPHATAFAVGTELGKAATR